jgi:hypothetical protein
LRALHRGLSWHPRQASCRWEHQPSAGRYPGPPGSNPGSRNGTGCLIGRLVCHWLARESKRNSQAGRILLGLAAFVLAGFVLLVLIGLWDGYEQETKALGFSGIYGRYLASQVGFADDAKAYRAVVEAESALTAVVAETAAINVK